MAKAATSKRAPKANASAPPPTTNRERPPEPKRHQAGKDELLE